MDWFSSIVRQPGATADERAFYRYQVANLLVSEGDTARARREYQAIIEEFGAAGEEPVPKVVGFCEKAIEHVDRLEKGR